MEEAIYRRQVAKNALAKRVVDEQQIDRHYKRNDLLELYATSKLEPDHSKRHTLPNDPILKELLAKYGEMFYSFHTHDSLLVNKEDEDLTAEEKESAWKEFEDERDKLKSKNSIKFPCLQIGIKYLSKLLHIVL